MIYLYLSLTCQTEEVTQLSRMNNYDTNVQHMQIHLSYTIKSE